MKKILLATDFSDVSQNAISYAIEMFGKAVYNNNARFIIFHAHYIAASTPSYADGVVYDQPVMVDEVRDNLVQACEELRGQYPGLDIRANFATGMASDEILEVANEENVDLIVMGSVGTGGVGRVLLGSTANSIAKSSDCPVLIVPKDAVVQKPGKIVFATDFKKLENMDILNPLRDVVGHYSPELFLLHMYGKNTTTAEERDAMNDKIKAYFDNDNYKKLFMEDDDPAQGIADFVTGYKTDMLALIGQERGFFGNLFHKSVTAKLISYATLPLLILKAPEAAPDATTTSAFRKTINAQVAKWKGELEALNVQMNLGKAELSDEVEEQGKKAKAKLQQAKIKLQKAEDVAESRWSNFKDEMSEAIGHIKKAIVG